MISILCPTRERPELVKRMMKSAIQTASGDIEILLGIDADDKSYLDLKPCYGEKCFYPKNRTVGEIWNLLATRCHGDFLMMGNDDLVFQTRGWDLLIPEYKDGIFVAWFDDGSPKANFRCAFPIVSRKWYETLGYFTPECFKFFYHDTWIHDIGKRVGRTHYISEAIVEHKHFAFKKAPMDETYKRNRRAPLSAMDGETFSERVEQREADAEKIRAIMEK